MDVYLGAGEERKIKKSGVQKVYVKRTNPRKLKYTVLESGVVGLVSQGTKGVKGLVPRSTSVDVTLVS